MTRELPAPAQVRATFARLLADDAERAASYLFNLGLESGYLKSPEPDRDLRWESGSAFGVLELSINRAKPEKDPRAIARAAAGGAAAAGTVAAGGAAAGGGRGAPLCELCWENEGFRGAAGLSAKPGLRIAALELGGERWGLQYSPYAYFKEHCIALSEEHRPMKVDAACFERLLDFVDALPFYFVGSNADLPLVGGSILCHDHYQGGRHVFALMKAPVEEEVRLGGLSRLRCGVVRWPASALRLVSSDRRLIAEGAQRVLELWQGFSFERCDILAHSPAEGDPKTPHNTLNPVVRRVGRDYVMELVLRNNRQDEARPWGVFHPGEELHHLKKENIGLIEIMGLAVLPARLARELPAVQRALLAASRREATPGQVEALLQQSGDTAAHAAWAAGVYARHRGELAKAAGRLPADGRDGPAGPCAATGAASGARPEGRLLPLMRRELARAFVAILSTTGVFKRDEAGRAGWRAFIDAASRR